MEAMSKMRIALKVRWCSPVGFLEDETKGMCVCGVSDCEEHSIPSLAALECPLCSMLPRDVKSLWDAEKAQDILVVRRQSSRDRPSFLLPIAGMLLTMCLVRNPTGKHLEDSLAQSKLAV